MKPPILALAFIVVALQTNAYAQAPAKCELDISQAPEVRGLKLDQPSAKLRELFGDDGSSFSRKYLLDRDPDELGKSTVLLSSILFRSERLKGISDMTLTYLDDRLASIHIYYDPEVKWQSSAHFAAAIADQLKLPAQGWVNRTAPRLECQGFFVEVYAESLLPRLRIERTDLTAELDRRSNENERKKRANFKP